MMVGVGSRVPREIYERICEDAELLGVTRSEVIRRILVEHYRREDAVVESLIEEERRKRSFWRWLKERLL